MNGQSTSHTPANGLMAALAAIGGAGIALSLAIVLPQLLTEHHAAFGTSSDGVIWGLPVANYVFFVLASTGLTFVASIALVFNLKHYYPVAKRCVWLAIATLIAGFTSLAFEMGNPFRMLWAIPAAFQIRSPLNWMGVLYLAYMVLLLLKFRKMAADDWTSPASKGLGRASFVTVILAHSTLGLAFGMIATRPFWFGSIVPLYFLLTALLSGVALAVLAHYAAYGFDARRQPPAVRSLFANAMPGLFVTVLGLTLVAVVGRTVTGLWSNQDGFQAFDHMVASPLFHLEIWAGMVLPFVLLALSRTRTQPGVQVACAALVLVALFIGRYEFIVGGQVVPVFKGIAVGDFVEYTPSLTEVMLTVLSVSVMLAIYALGERYLALDAVPHTEGEASNDLPYAYPASSQVREPARQYASAD